MNRRAGFFLIAFLIMLLMLISNYFNRQMEYTTHIEGVMDTSVDLALITDKDGEKIINDISSLIKNYDKKFSHTDSSSELYTLNNSYEEKLSDEAYELIKGCEKFYNDTNGKFDITVGMLSNIWNETFKTGILPNEQIVDESLKTVGYDSLVFNDTEKSIKITKDLLNINLGAVVKGYTADKIKDILELNKIKNALINLGGNIYAKGKNKNGDLWNIGICDPKNNDEILLSLRLSDKFIITSGNYIRYKDIDSVRYHHIIDSKTGYPVFNELNSVTIIADSGFIGDALSTACFLEGFEESKELLEKYAVLAIFATNDNKIYYSEELENSIHKVAENYEYIAF